MAEALLRARLSDIAPEVSIGSAGLLFDGRRAERHAVKAMAKRGLDIEGHASQCISAELLAGTSMILAMERAHVRAVAVIDPRLFDRSFTLPELVNAAQAAGPRPPDVDLRSWVEHLGALRVPADYNQSDPSSEIADPMGRSFRAFRACAETIDRHLEALVELAWPIEEPSDPDVAPPPGGIHADRDRR